VNLKSLLIRFLPDGTYALESSAVDGARATAQNATVNLLTENGTDPVYAERGTRLLSAITKGGAYDIISATHAANFAAADTIFFCRDSDPADISEVQQLSDLKLAPAAVGRSLTLTASFVFQNGIVLGQPVNTTTP
jgi:hypothetical protein